MIDIHSHILPEVDDGSHSLDESLEMCRASADDGIKIMVATPHAHDGLHRTHDPELLARETLRTYRNFLGQSFPKVAKKSRNSPRQKTGKPLSISGQNRDY